MEKEELKNMSVRDLGTLFLNIYEKHGFLPKHLAIFGEIMRKVEPEWKYSGEYNKN